LQYCSTDVRAQNDLGVAYYQRGGKHDSGRARDHFQAALRLDPNYSSARQNLSNLYRGSSPGCPVNGSDSIHARL